MEKKNLSHFFTQILYSAQLKLRFLALIILGLMIINGQFMSSAYAQDESILLIAHPKIVAIPIVDNQEPLIDLKNQEEIAYGPSPEVPNNTNYTKMRKAVYQKLKQAQDLLPKNLHFCVYEGYRCLDLQKALFDERFSKVQNQHPDWSQDEIFSETTKLIAPTIRQDGSKNIPPHSTGGAIDVYLINDEGIPVDMGIHPKYWMMDDDGSLSLTLSQKISIEAQKNREILRRVLSAVGFVNYPTEYWHWSYGDQYWAHHSGNAYAIYGSYTSRK